MAGRQGAGSGASRFLAPYYTVSALLVVGVYPLLRWRWLEAENFKYSRLQPGGLWEKERLVLSMLGASLAAKFWKRTSWDAFLSEAALYGKCAVGILAWFMDWRLAVYYGLAVAVAYLLFPQPLFRGPSAVQALTPAAFKSLVEDAPPGVSWLVEFYAPWSPACIHLEPVVAELSLEYAAAGERLQWGKVDASRWPQLAQAHQVAVYGAAPALPTFIMFEKGKELGRIPHLFADGTSSTNITIRRQDIISAFALHEFLEAPPQAAPGGGSGSGGGGGGRGGSSAKKRGR